MTCRAIAALLAALCSQARTASRTGSSPSDTLIAPVKRQRRVRSRYAEPPMDRRRVARPVCAYLQYVKLQMRVGIGRDAAAGPAVPHPIRADLLGGS
jgi:hypothetical protein